MASKNRVSDTDGGSTSQGKKRSVPRSGRVRKRRVVADRRHDFPRYPAFLDLAGAWAALRAGKGVGLEDIQP